MRQLQRVEEERFRLVQKLSCRIDEESKRSSGGCGAQRAGL
jgi:hypothetical protein